MEKDELKVRHGDHLWASLASVQKMHDHARLSEREQVDKVISPGRRTKQLRKTYEQASSVGRDCALPEPAASGSVIRKSACGQRRYGR